jgi:hypothetical protein
MELESFNKQYEKTLKALKISNQDLIDYKEIAKKYRSIYEDILLGGKEVSADKYVNWMNDFTNEIKKQKEIDLKKKEIESKKAREQLLSGEDIKGNKKKQKKSKKNKNKKLKKIQNQMEEKKQPSPVSQNQLKNNDSNNDQKELFTPSEPSIDEKINYLIAMVEKFDKKFDVIDKKFDKMDERFEKLKRKNTVSETEDENSETDEYTLPDDRKKSDRWSRAFLNSSVRIYQIFFILNTIAFVLFKKGIIG